MSPLSKWLKNTQFWFKFECPILYLICYFSLNNMGIVYRLSNQLILFTLNPPLCILCSFKIALLNYLDSFLFHESICFFALCRSCFTFSSLRIRTLRIDLNPGCRTVDSRVERDFSRSLHTRCSFFRWTCPKYKKVPPFFIDRKVRSDVKTKVRESPSLGRQKLRSLESGEVVPILYVRMSDAK